LLLLGVPALPQDSTNIPTNSYIGSVLIFTGSPGCPSAVACTYTKQAKAELSPPPGSNNFGHELAMHDKLLAVGAPGNATVPGAVFVYRYSYSSFQTADSLSSLPSLVCSIFEPASTGI
jgi:hypothetical protein